MSRRETLPLIIFVGGVSGKAPERWVGLACRANTLDTVAKAVRAACLGPIVIVTPTEGWGEELARLPVEVVADEPGAPFHFGRRLREVAAGFGFSRLLYMGGGMGSLLPASELAALAERALALDRGVLTNNPYSADLVALAPASTLASIDLPDTDNDLAWRLAAAGLPVESLPPTAASRLDLDTPNDLAIASLHPACGPALRKLVVGLPLDTQRARRVASEMHNSQGQVLAYGRVSAASWAVLESLPCQSRIFAEERGMRASGRLAHRQVRAWIGAFLQQAGPRIFFQTLAGACTAALLDSRVLFAHLGLSPTAGDRFHSDLLQPGPIADPAIRAFTEAAADVPVPLLLGGQSLVSGGLLALAEIEPGPTAGA
jgi:hypothetical protein